jgi:hypothetical protein
VHHTYIGSATDAKKIINQQLKSKGGTEDGRSVAAAAGGGQQRSDGNGNGNKDEDGNGDINSNSNGNGDSDASSDGNVEGDKYSDGCGCGGGLVYGGRLGQWHC